MKKYIIMIIVLVNCFVMGFIDAIITPDYFVKSLCKIILFSSVTFIYFYLSKNKDILKLFKVNKKDFKTPVILGITLMILTIFIYFIASNFVDLETLKISLQESYGNSLLYFLIVIIYITVINSFLEELFFRGFAFQTLKKHTNLQIAFVFSSLTFALYHVAFMINWFTFQFFILLVISLFLGGLFFNFISHKCNNIYSSWIIHAFVNLSINSIGLILFLN